MAGAPAEGAPARAAATIASEGAVELELEIVDGLGGLLMSTPTVVVTDVRGGDLGRLKLGATLNTAGGDRAPLTLRSTSAGWALVSTTLTPTPEGPNQVHVRSRAALWVEARDAASGAGLSDFDLTVETRWIDGCCPIGIQSPTLEARSASGGIAVEGLDVRAPIEVGGASEARVQVRAEGYLPVRSEWVELEPGLVPVQVTLATDPTLPATLQVTVVDDLGQPVADAAVSAFDEDGAAPILEVYLTGDRTYAARQGVPSHPREPARATTDGSGRASLAVRAPLSYAIHAVAGPVGARTGVMERGVDVPIAGAAIELTLGGAGELTGQVLGDGRDWGVAAELGPVVLEGAQQRLTAELDPEGRFDFAGLASGTYTLRLLASGDELQGLVVTEREVEIDRDRSRHVVLSTADPSGLSIQLPPPDGDGELQWLVAVGALVDGRPEPRFQRQGVSGATVKIDNDAAEDLFVAAFGQRPGEPLAAFAFADIDGDSQASLVLRVDPATLTLESAGGAVEAVRLAMPDSDPVVAALVGSAPPMELDPGAALRVRGLPEGRVDVLVDDATFETTAHGRISIP